MKKLDYYDYETLKTAVFWTYPKLGAIIGLLFCFVIYSFSMLHRNMESIVFYILFGFFSQFFLAVLFYALSECIERNKRYSKRKIKKLGQDYRVKRLDILCNHRYRYSIIVAADNISGKEEILCDQFSVDKDGKVKVPNECVSDSEFVFVLNDFYAFYERVIDLSDNHILTAKELKEEHSMFGRL